MSTTIGGLKYMGNIGGLPGYFEQPGAELDVDDYGLDILTRQYIIRPDTASITAFKNAFPKGKQDTTFLWLYVVSYKINDVTGVLGMATVVFKGSTLALGENANLPRKQTIKLGLATQTVTLSDLAHLENGATRDVTYRAPWSEWRYISTVDPHILGPQHKGEIIQNNKTATTLWARGAIGKTIIRNDYIFPPGQTPTVPEAAQFVGLLKVVGSKFDIEQVGNVYTVLERNELIVVDYLMFLYNNLTGW